MNRILATFGLVAGLILAPLVASAADGVSPVSVEGAVTVTPEEAMALYDEEVTFVDVRKPSDFDAGRVPGAIHLDVKSALSEASLAEVAGKDDPVLFYCNGHACMRSSQACSMAVGWGYTKVYYLRDGYPAWESAGFPVE